MIKHSLCVGINAYATAPLQGCVNDANDWGTLFNYSGYRNTTLLDADATKANILDRLDYLTRTAKRGDHITFQFSGHGSWVPDSDGLSDEPDGRDEVLCAYDYQNGGYITDDELQAVASRRKRGVRFTIIADSCHSGSVSRFALLTNSVPRFIRPTSFLTGLAAQRATAMIASDPITTPRHSRGAVLFSGCDDHEFSYDARINGRYNGAFTQAAIHCYEPGLSYGRWHKKIREYLDFDNYPQTPQLYASLWQRLYRL